MLVAVDVCSMRVMASVVVVGTIAPGRDRSRCAASWKPTISSFTVSGVAAIAILLALAHAAAALLAMQHTAPDGSTAA